VNEVFEDGDRRDACPTPRAADKRLRSTEWFPTLRTRKRADMVAAGILPAVEPGFQPGGENIENSEQ